MSDETAPHAKRDAGGCLCWTVWSELAGELRYARYCFCADCRKASGSGFAG
jgi:hypothetical protein